MYEEEENREPAKFTFKIVVGGNIGVGKSNLINRYVSDNFDENLLTTIGVDFKTKTTTIDKTKIKVQFWDTAGQEKNKSIARSYYKNSNGALLIYDISDRQSFDNLTYWLEEMTSSAPADMKIVLLGNKNDLLEQREISQEEGREWAEGNGFFFMEVSAKENKDECVAIAFDELLKEIKNDMREEEMIQNSNSTGFKDGQQVLIGRNHDSIDEGKKKKCC